jgi:hypothetical protein
LEGLLESRNAVIAYIYFDYAERQTQSALDITASILRQWANFQKELDPAIRTLYESFRSKMKRPTELSQYMDCMKSVAKSFSSTFVIFDALDECDLEQRSELRNLIIMLNEIPARIFATCRPHLHNFRELFRTASKIEIEAHLDDLRTYLLKAVDERKPDYESTIKQAVVQRLSSEANRL